MLGKKWISATKNSKKHNLQKWHLYCSISNSFRDISNSSNSPISHIVKITSQIHVYLEIEDRFPTCREAYRYYVVCHEILWHVLYRGFSCKPHWYFIYFFDIGDILCFSQITGKNRKKCNSTITRVLLDKKSIWHQFWRLTFFDIGDILFF